MASAANVVPLQTQEAKLDDQIEAQITTLQKATPLTLPKADSELSKLYVKKIEGKYNVERAKKDTDNAIDLLYIAYNATPQEHSEIRVSISDIMHGLIKAQQKSEITMRKTMGIADSILADLGKLNFPDWLDVRKCKGPEDTGAVADIKDFLKKDIIDLAKTIKGKALIVKKELDAIAVEYDVIINATQAATSKSETALAEGLKNKAAIEKEINEAKAKRESLQAMVNDLADSVAKYDRLAKQYESRANTAEERAFIMSIVQVGAQMVAAAVPAIAMAATGGASVIASAAATTAKRAVGDKNSDTEADNSSDTKVIAKKKEISDKQAEVTKSETKIAELKKGVAGLETDVKNEEAKGTKRAANKAEPKTTLDELDERVENKKGDLKKEEENRTTLLASLTSLQDSLQALEKGLGKMIEKQDNTATNLRELQFKMLDKVETYEKERRTQNAELVKINALLTGKLSTGEMISLAIQSLNVSISALKRTKEIIVEIAFFFKSFADFMDHVADETATDIELFENFVAKEKVRTSYLSNLIEGGDKFFIRQTGEWHAIKFVCEKFCNSFADGWSKVNKLSGKYLVGKELEDYLKKAGDRIDEIVKEREAAAQQKIKDIGAYREQARAGAMGA